MEIAARDIHLKYEDLMVFPLFTWRVPNITNELLTLKEQQLGIHAGDAETSLMLSILPEQVKMEKAVAEYPDLPADTLLSMEGNLPFAWVTKDLSRSGVFGDPTVATKEKGDRILQSLSDGWVQVIQDIHAFRQPQAFNRIFDR